MVPHKADDAGCDSISYAIYQITERVLQQDLPCPDFVHRNELHHSIPSLARASNAGGIVRPRQAGPGVEPVNDFGQPVEGGLELPINERG